MRAQSPVGFWLKIQGLTSRLVLISDDTCLDPMNGTKFPQDHKILRENSQGRGVGNGEWGVGSGEWRAGRGEWGVRKNTSPRGPSLPTTPRHPPRTTHAQLTALKASSIVLRAKSH